MRRLGFRSTLLAGVAAALIGACLAVALAGGSAAASGSYVWTPYDESSESGGSQITGTPSLLADPQQGNEDVVAGSPSGSILQFSGDGSGSVNVTNVTSAASGPSASGSPVAITDPQDNDFLIFFDSSGVLETFDRTASNFVWKPYDISQEAGGQQMTGNPSLVVGPSGVLTAATDSSNGHLIIWTRDPSSFAWATTDISATVGLVISGDPLLTLDPNGGYPEVFAQGNNGDLLEFYKTGAGWTGEDITADNGGQTINSDPVSVVVNGLPDVFADSPGGDLIEWSRSAAGNWSSQNLTSLSGGPTISGAPSAVVESDGTIDVFAAAANQHLIEYTGSGSSFSATDLTADDGGPAADAAPAAGTVASIGNLAVWVASPASALIELERTAAPTAPSSTSPAGTTTTATVTQTVESSPTPTPTPKGKGKPKAQVKVKVATDWSWTRTISELHWIKMGKLKRGEGLSLVCRGTGKKKTTGCPYKKRSARGPAAVKQLIHESAKTRYRVGVVLTLTVSETGLRSEQARFKIRSRKKPAVSA